MTRTMGMVSQPLVMEDVATKLCREMQQAFARMISLLPGRLARPSHLQRCLNIDPKLAWQVFKIAKSEDPLEAVRHMPSMVSIKRVIAAARTKGVPKDVLEAVRASIMQFDEAGILHADGRASFTAMVAAIRGENSAEALAIQNRRAAFRVNCQLWGSQTGVFFQQTILRRLPSGELKSAVVTVKRDFRRLRADALPLSYGRAATNRQGELVHCSEVPIDVAAFGTYGVPLLPEYCSKPTPTFGQPEWQNGWQIQYMDGENIGKLGACDFVIAVCRDESLMELSDGRKVALAGFSSRVPTELAIMDVLIHRPSLGVVHPQFRAMPELGVNIVTELERPYPQMPTFERVQNLGEFTAAPPVSEVRDYMQMTNRILSHLQWPEGEFDVHRVSIRHPILHSMSVLWFELDGG